MFFRSIRFKIVLWYMLLLTLTLLSFSFILYGSFSKVLYNDLDDLLSSRAEGLANSINAYYDARQSAPLGSPAEHETFIKSAGEWVETKLKDPEQMSIFVQILNDKGERLVASKNTPAINALPSDVLDDIRDGEDSFDILKSAAQGKKREKFRAYTRPVIRNNKVVYMVQVSGSTGLLALATMNLAWVLFGLLPLTVILAGLPGVVLVRLTLKPVDEMIDTIKQTTAENLKLKIHIPDTKDEIKRLADTFNDMIERLDRSFSSQQSFIQDLSAELKAPLETLRSEFVSASDKPLPQEEYRTIMRRGTDEIDRFEKILNELETLAKFDNSKMSLEIRKVNLSRMLDKVIGDFRAEAQKKGLDLSSVLKESIIIDGDQTQLKRLFGNIIDNAVKFTNRNGSVTVSAHKARNRAVVTINDTGIGIEDSELPYIFDRFYQVNKSRAANGSFGLGLSIAKSVADVHKGAILVESAPGKGSSFTVSLPLSYPG